MGALEIRPIDAPLGAEVRGVRFDQPLDDGDRRALLGAIAEHHLLILRGHEVPPSNRAYRDFGLRFGPLRASVADLSRFRDFAEINLVSNTVEPDGIAGTGGDGLIDWHADLNFEPPTTDYIVLDALELPAAGGNTKFANLVAAYDALPPARRDQIAPLEVRYTFKQDLEYARLSDEQRRSLRAITHSLVQARFPALRRSVWPNVAIFDGVVIDMPLEPSRALLAELLAHATAERFVYEHEWQPGDCALWSNWAVFHRRDPFDPGARRLMRHLTVSEGGPQLGAHAPITLNQEEQQP
jgi:taurine dioxygenase